MWFHTVIWPAMLFAANIEPPKKVFAHGWLLTSELKIGKSSGNAVDLTYLIEKYGADTLRYFLFRTIPFGQDGDFSEDKLSERLNNELANGLGNLLNRTLALIEKNCAGKIPEAKTDPELQKKLKLEEIISEMDSLEMHKAVSEIFSFVDSCNKYIAEKEPWKKTGKELETILYSIADSLRIISILLWPFIPLTSEKIQEQLGLEKKQHTLKECKFNLLKSGTKTKKSEVLFKKIE
jgi:methionyl-tRNA synthetase